MKTTHVKAMSCLLCCAHCAHEQVADAMPAENMLDVLRGFLLMHRRCEKPVEPSKQILLFEPSAAGMTVDTGALVRNYVDNPLNGTGPVRGQSFAIDASTDEPAPEIDPPGAAREVYSLDCPCPHPARRGSHEIYTDGKTQTCRACGASEPDDTPEHDKPELTEGDLPDYYAVFAEMYPMASEPIKLTEQARRALGNTDYSAHLFDHVAKWHPSSVAFQETAHWARVECAHLDSEARGLTNPIPGLTIPAALPIPKSLQEALKLPQKKRAGARPLSSPSAALPAVAPVKKTRKRRTSSTPTART